MTQLKLRSEVFMREDLEAILRAVDFSQERLLAHMPQADAELYREGFTTAMQAVAIALHIEWPQGQACDLTVPWVRVIEPSPIECRRSVLAPATRMSTLGARSHLCRDNHSE
jgi:hypothetical protein